MSSLLKGAAGVLSIAFVLSLAGSGTPSVEAIGNPPVPVKRESPARPDQQLVNDLDQAIQFRFQAMPNFGIRRIVTLPEPNPHLEGFYANGPEEERIVAALDEGHWRSAIYLFGRRAQEIIDERSGKKRLSIHYKINAPVPVSKDLKAGGLTRARKFVDEVDLAFDAFATRPSYEFERGDWSYVARPVIARESCMQCHSDMFVTAKLDKKRWAYRARKPGDPIGVLIYAFKQRD